jgi:prevent-host-death family protein
MADRTIPQRELRNNVGAVLRDAEAGSTFTVTVRGKPVARVVPLEEGPRRFVDAETLREILRMPIDDQYAADIEGLEEPIGDPWEGRD